MNSKQREILTKILSNKTSGSSEILSMLNTYLLHNISNRKLFHDTIRMVQSKFSHFAAINNYLNKLTGMLELKNGDLLEEYLINFKTEENLQFKIIFDNIFNKLPSAKSILTISKSGTLINIFKLWHKRKSNLKLIITESRPANEGKLMVKELLKTGLKIELITEAMSGIFIPKSDAVIIGADAVLKNGNVINKSGSLFLAVLCKYYKKPFYVLTTKSKFVNRNRYKISEELSDTVWKFAHPNLRTINIPFEEIDRKLITEIISE